MNGLEDFSGLSGLYVLTPDGHLSVWTHERQLKVDTALSRVFAAHNRDVLAAYQAPRPRDTPLRTGIIYKATVPRPWGLETLRLDEATLRDVYRVSGPSGQALTAFQKKNREKSIYKGFELLLDYRTEASPDAPIYCPVLYPGGRSLGQLASAFDVQPAEEESRRPVIEVINLIATIPMSRRLSPEVQTLLLQARKHLIKKGMRQTNDYELLDQVAVGTTQAEEGSFFDVDKRDDRAVALPEGFGRRLPKIDDLPTNERIHQVEQWLERPHRPVDAALLRTFAQFRDLDPERLELLAERALVHTAPGGTRLLQHGMSDHWNLYLLEGSLSLEAADGQSLLVTAGSERAASPVAFLKPRKYTVTATTAVSFLWIHDALLAVVLEPVTAATKPSLLKPD